MAVNKSRLITSKSPCHRVLDLDNFNLPDNNRDGFYSFLDELAHERKKSRQRSYTKPKVRLTKYRGVYVQRSNICHPNKTYHYTFWRGLICAEGKVHFLGLFPFTPEGEKQAALLHDKAAIKLYGDDAKTNQMMYPEDFI